MQPTDTKPAVQATIIALDGTAGRPLGPGVLIRKDIVLAAAELSEQLHGHTGLFPTEQDDHRVLFDADRPDERAPDGPAYAVELADGERRERFDVCQLYRSVGTPRPWVGLGLAGRSALPLSELPVEARKGLDEGPLEGSNLVCALFGKAC